MSPRGVFWVSQSVLSLHSLIDLDKYKQPPPTPNPNAPGGIKQRPCQASTATFLCSGAGRGGLVCWMIKKYAVRLAAQRRRCEWVLIWNDEVRPWFKQNTNRPENVNADLVPKGCVGDAKRHEGKWQRKDTSPLYFKFPRVLLRFQCMLLWRGSHIRAKPSSAK